MCANKKPTGIYIIPTGIGARTGGYGGDALPYAKKLSRYCEHLIVNPNVANAGAYYGMTDNMVYAEGLAIDMFMEGEAVFVFSPAVLDNTRIGVIFDRAIESLPAYIYNANRLTIDAMRTSVGIDVAGYVLTDEPVGAMIDIQDGISMGSLDNLPVIYDAVDKLLAQGCNRIAISCLLDESLVSGEAKKAYESGQGVDPIGGMEAIISHSIIARYNVMAAHAPLLPVELPDSIDNVDPRVASEYSSFTFLPSIIYGLSRSPGIVRPDEAGYSGCLNVGDIDFVVVPNNCFGNPVVLESLARGITVFSMADNTNNSQLEPDKYGQLFDDVIYCRDHNELFEKIKKLGR